MAELHIVLPMAGRAVRFKSQAIEKPKPMISIDDRSMFEWSIGALEPLVYSPDLDVKVSAVIREDDDRRFGLTGFLRERFARLQIQKISNSESPVESCLAASDSVSSTSALLIVDCDFIFAARSFVAAISQPLKLQSENIFGMNIFFQSQARAYSYVRCEGDRVVEFAEKNPISEAAIAGAYYFREAGPFFKTCKRVLSTNSGSESYVSHVCQRLLTEGYNFRAIEVDSFESFGTPEELRRAGRRFA